MDKNAHVPAQVAHARARSLAHTATHGPARPRANPARTPPREPRTAPHAPPHTHVPTRMRTYAQPEHARISPNKGDSKMHINYERNVTLGGGDVRGGECDGQTLQSTGGQQMQAKGRSHPASTSDRRLRKHKRYVEITHRVTSLSFHSPSLSFGKYRVS